MKTQREVFNKLFKEEKTELSARKRLSWQGKRQQY